MTLSDFQAVACVLLLPLTVGIDLGFHECCGNLTRYILPKKRDFPGDFGYA
jgi:hypothetical protein